MRKKPTLMDVSQCEGSREVHGLHVQGAELAGILRGSFEASRRMVVRDSTFERCLVSPRLFVFEIECRDLVVDSLATQGLFQFAGTLFRRVRFRGRIGRVMFGRSVPAEPAARAAAAASVTMFYAGVSDWALDLSEGDFAECDVRGIPPRLLKLNPEHQIVITRSMLARLGHEHPWVMPGGPLSGSHFILRYEEYLLFTTSPRNRNYRERMEVMAELRRLQALEDS